MLNGFAALIIDDDTTEDGRVLVPSPDEGRTRIVTRLRYSNRDSAAHTPEFFIHRTDNDSIQQGIDYVGLYPDREVAAAGWLEDDAPVAVLADNEEIVVVDETAPTNTERRDMPTAVATWLDP